MVSPIVLSMPYIPMVLILPYHLKYNDGDAIYYPQVIDELPLDITLRSGEYWQDGYIVKANGNAEASPLGKVFSAWNYGQIEANLR